MCSSDLGRGMLAVAGGEAVAQEKHVELRALGGGRDLLHQPEIGPARGDGVGMTPAADMVAWRLHEDAEAHLLLVGHDVAFVRTKSSVQHLPGVDPPGLEGVIVTPCLAAGPKFGRMARSRH